MRKISKVIFSTFLIHIFDFAAADARSDGDPIQWRSEIAIRRGTSTVTSQSQFTSAIASSVTIELASDISLTSAISISSVTNLIINGNAYKLDAQLGSYRCMSIAASTASLNDITMTRGNPSDSSTTSGQGGALFIGSYSTVTLTSCIFSSNLNSVNRFMRGIIFETCHHFDLIYFLIMI